MASYEEIMQAVRNAHDAGDTEAAQRLAQMAHEAKSKAPEKKADFDLGTAVGSSFANVGNMADIAGSTLLGGAKALFGNESGAVATDDAMRERIKQRNQWANPTGRDLSGMEKFVGGVSTLPMQVLAGGLSPASTVDTMLQSGETTERALGAGAIDAAGNALGIAIPGWKQGTALVRGGTGAVAGGLQEAVTKGLIQQVAETEKGKRAFQPTLEDTLVAGATGGMMGAGFGSKGVNKGPGPDLTALREEGMRPKTPLEGQGDLFPESLTDTSGHASQVVPPNVEPIPSRSRGQMELPLRNDLPEVIRMDEAGVSVRPEDMPAVDRAKGLELERMYADAKARMDAENLTAKQADIFEPQTNMHRDFTDQRLDDGAGGERPLTRAEFNQTIKALAEEPGTRFQKPEDMAAAYAEYRSKLNEPGLFDIGSRADEIKEQRYQADIPRMVEEHPLVKKADERIQKISEVITKAQLAIKEGYPHGPQLIRATKELTSLEKKATEVRANVTEALRKKESPKSVGLKGQPITSGSKYSRQRGAVLLPFGRKPVSDQIKKNKSLENLLPEHVTVAPTPADVAAKVLSTTDVTENRYTKTTRLFTKGFQYEKGKTNHPLIKYAYDEVSKAVDTGTNRLKKTLQEDILQPIRRLSDSDMIDLHAAMHDAMMNKYDLTPEMLAKHGFNEKQITVFNGWQKAYADVFKSTNEMLVANGQKPISRYTGYAAGIGTGDFRTAIVKTGDNGVPTFVGFVGSNIRAVRDANVKALLAKHPEYSIGPDQFVGDGKLSNAKSTALVEALALLGKEGSDTATFAKAYAEAMQGEAMGYQGANKHLLDKKGVFGNEGAKQWVTGWKAGIPINGKMYGLPMTDAMRARAIAHQNALDFFRAQVTYTETMTKWSELSKASKNIAEVLSNPAVQADHPIASRMVKEYLSNALGHNPSKVGTWLSDGVDVIGQTIGVGPAVFRSAIGGLTSAQKVTFFAFSPGFLSLNYIQALVGTPMIVNKLRARGVDVAAIDKTGISEYIKASAIGTQHLFNKVRGKEDSDFSKRMFAYGEEHGMSATQIFDHNTDIRMGAHFIASKTAEVGMGVAEGYPRMSAFIMISNILRKNGLANDPDIFKVAHELTNDIMADYRPHEQARVNRMFGPLAPLLGAVSTFANNASSLNASVFREAMKTKDGSTLVAMTLTGLVIHGALGFPGVDEVGLLVEWISKAIGKPTTLTNEIMKITAGKEGGDFIAMGLGTELGLALHQSSGRASFLPPQLHGGTTSAAIDTGKAVWGAITSPSEMSAKRLAYNLSPRVAKGFEDLTWFSKDDMALSRKEGYASKGIYERDEFDKTARKFGVTSVNEFKAKEQDRQQIIQDQAYKKLQDSIIIKMDNEHALNKGKHDGERLQEHFEKYIEVEGNPKTFIMEAKRMGYDINTTAMQRYLAAKSKAGDISAKKALVRLMENNYGDK